MSVEGHAGRYRWRRRFSWLASLADHEKLWLTISGVGPCRVELNGSILADSPDDPAEFDVSERVARKNEILIEPTASRTGNQLSPDVALEVRCLAYLRDVEFRVSEEGGRSRVRATGLIVGPGDLKLDLYLLHGRHPLEHRVVSPGPGGVPFTLSGDVADPDVSDIAAVELVHGPVVWCRHEGDSSTR